jgi:hypothetical protein
LVEFRLFGADGHVVKVGKHGKWELRTDLNRLFSVERLVFRKQRVRVSEGLAQNQKYINYCSRFT